VARTVYPTCSPGGSGPEKDQGFIIFLRFNRNAKRFSFAACGAMEKAECLEEIKSLAEVRLRLLSGFRLLRSRGRSFG
jgi:hypothetical protein